MADLQIYRDQCTYRYQSQVDPPVLTHEVTNTEFEMKCPDSLLLTSSGQEWQFHIATDM